MGTSLEVQPFASLTSRVNKSCVRLLINREAVGENDCGSIKSFLFNDGLKFNQPDNKRDVCWLGDCDDGIENLAQELGLEVYINIFLLRITIYLQFSLQVELKEMIKNGWDELSNVSSDPNMKSNDAAAKI